MKDRELHGVLEWLMKKRGVYHAILAVEDVNGKPVWSGTLGIADSTGRQMDIDTPYFIASVTKLCIAVVTLRLVESRRLELDQPLQSIAPKELVERLHELDGVDYTPQITIRHLLSHTSGLPDYIEDRPISGKPLIAEMLAEDDRVIGIDEVCNHVRKALKPHFPPGSASITRSVRARYSDTNFRLLITVIEVITSHKWQDAIRAELLVPLGLRHTWVVGDSPLDDTQSPAAIWDGDKLLDKPRLLGSFGDLYSTASDQLDLLRAITKGFAFSDAGTAALMTRNFNSFGFDPTNPRLPGWPLKYGMGMMHFQLPRWITPFKSIPAVLGHTGSTGCWLFFCPDLELYMCGNVSQVGAGAVPFRATPRILRIFL